MSEDYNICRKIQALETEVARLTAIVEDLRSKDEYVMQILEGYVDGINLLNERILTLEEKLK